jgi:hypothetical protein
LCGSGSSRCAGCCRSSSRSFNELMCSFYDVFKCDLGFYEISVSPKTVRTGLVISLAKSSQHDHLGVL